MCCLQNLFCNNESFLVVIRNWKSEDDKAITSPYFTLADPSIIGIEQDGLYVIQAQLTWRKRGGPAAFNILNSEKPFIQCVSTFSEDYATVKTCFTSRTQYLKKGDKLSIAIESTDPITVDFDDRKSFISVTLLSEESST